MMCRFGPILAGVLSCALLVGPAAAVGPEGCDVPDYLAHSDGKLPRVGKALKKEQRLDVLVFGTGSSTLAGPEGAKNSYPARLEAELTRRLPDSKITVRTDVKNRRTAGDMDKGLEALLQDPKPTLVVWQTGTFDAMRGIYPEEFRTALEHGVQTIRAAGSDVVLMNMQYSPRTDSMIAAGTYAENMRWVAQQQDLPLFDRLAMMKHWNEAGIFDLANASDKSRLAERVHDCVGKLLAELIVDAAHLKKDGPKDINEPKETK